MLRPAQVRIESTVENPSAVPPAACLRDRLWRFGGGWDREPGGVKRVAHGGKRLAVCVVASFAEKSPGQGRTLFEQVVEHAAQVLGVGGSRSSSAARSQAWRTSQEQLTVSTVPVLAFNGAADPVEQPRNWAGARKVFPDSREYALPGQGHDVNSDSWMACARPLTQTFIEQASAARLDTSCLASVPAPPFEPTLP